MAKPGPKPTVSDERLLLELYVGRNGGKFASQITENVEMETVQGVRDRLNDLVEATDYVEVNTVSGRNLYRLTDAGEAHLTAELRQCIS